MQVLPQEMWLLGRICRSSDPISLVQLANLMAVAHETLDAAAERLVIDGLAVRDWKKGLLPSSSGRETFDRIVAVYRHRLAEILERWSPAEHAEAQAMLDRFARDLVAAIVGGA